MPKFSLPVKYAPQSLSTEGSPNVRYSPTLSIIVQHVFPLQGRSPRPTICRYFVSDSVGRVNRPEQIMTDMISAFRVMTDPGNCGAVAVSIPLFKSQLAHGGPLTVTHPDIIRFFMLIPEACRLVLQAGTMGNGGEIYVFDMGKPVRIADLAQRMIDLSGAKDVKIQFTGLRDGEKLRFQRCRK